MIQAECNNCGKIDDAGERAAKATNHKCYWCHRGVMLPFDPPVRLIEIVGPDDCVRYRRMENDPDVAEARELIASGKVAYTLRYADTGESA